jgi:hypothetical protein
MIKRKFEVRREAENGDIWIVQTDRRDSVDSLAEQFRRDGLKNVSIVEDLD